MEVSDFLFDIHTDTKKEEQEIVEQFLQRLQYSNFELNQNERPDFIVKIEEKKIGIEITKYYSDFSRKGSKMQKNLIEWKIFALALKRKLETTNKELSKVYGAIHFKEAKFDLKILLKDDYYAELINCIIISKVLDNTTNTFEILESEFPLLSKYINHIYFENKSEAINFLWWDARLQSGNIIYDDNTITSNIILKKEKSSKGYSNDYDQKWLIIFAAGFGLADIYSEYKNDSKRQGTIFVMSFENKEYEHKELSISSTYFTHIYIWDKFNEKIFQVAPYYKKIFDYGERTIWINHLPIKQKEI